MKITICIIKFIRFSAYSLIVEFLLLFFVVVENFEFHLNLYVFGTSIFNIMVTVFVRFINHYMMTYLTSLFWLKKCIVFIGKKQSAHLVDTTACSFQDTSFVALWKTFAHYKINDINKENVRIIVSAHGTFLESPLSDTLSIVILESEMI